MDHDELLDILSVSRVNNRKHDITGMLIYGEGVFIQLIEGDKNIIDQVYTKISADPRHKNIIKMAEGDLTQRNFPEWEMGFKAANAAELAELGGYIDPTSKEFLKDTQSSDVINIMRTFIDMNRMSDNY
jgi:biotin carboxylase